MEKSSESFSCFRKPADLAPYLSVSYDDHLFRVKHFLWTFPASGHVHKLAKQKHEGRVTYLVAWDEDGIVRHGTVPQVGGMAQRVRPVGTEGPEAGGVAGGHGHMPTVTRGGRMEG